MAGESGWSSAVARSTSTRVRGVGARSARSRGLGPGPGDSTVLIVVCGPFGGSGGPAQEAAATGVHQAHEDDADEDGDLDQRRDAEVGVAQDQGPREEVDRVDGEDDVEERERDVPDLALGPADADRVDARLVGAQPL